MNMDVQKQKDLAFIKKPKVNLLKACSVNNGIMRLNFMDSENAIDKFNNSILDLTFFIPASGSGSRMFSFLHNFFQNTNHSDRNKVERFVNSLNNLALTRLIPTDTLKDFEEGTIDLKTFASYIVDEHGLGLGNLPKGLIPFHENSYFILNPFQEHVLQICKAFTDKTKIHYTINKTYEKAIEDSVKIAKQFSHFNPEVTYSEQNPESDSYVFYKNGEPLIADDGTYVRRPAGHGALIENLNNIKTRYFFIKNIDNIQHFNNDTSLKDFALLGGLLCQLNEALTEVLHAEHNQRYALLTEINKKFQLFQSPDDFPKDTETMEAWLNRPKRVCGMVKNEGQPGGGPFWVMNNGVPDKQIVEKAQISDETDQISILLKSTHFNPVMIACDSHNLNGEKLDLANYSDPNNYMIVEKDYNGEQVVFIEKPGLWNGGMANWISVFVEISSESFSPVKDVLNLLDAKHRP